MATRLEQLLAERSRQNAAVSEARRVARAARAQVTRAAKAQARHWELTSHSRRVVLIAYGLAEYDTEASAMYLAALGRQKGWPPKPDMALTRVVEDEFLVVDEHEFAALVDIGDPVDLPAMRAAIAFVAEWRVAVWARRWVLSTGATVPTATVLRFYHANCSLLPEELRPSFRGAVGEKRARKWVGRWRTRWGGFYGKVPIREPLDAEGALAKATDATRESIRISARPLISQAPHSACGQPKEGYPAAPAGRSLCSPGSWEPYTESGVFATPGLGSFSDTEMGCCIPLTERVLLSDTRNGCRFPTPESGVGNDPRFRGRFPLPEPGAAAQPLPM